MKTGNNRELKNVKPTVILAPKISLDLNTSFDQIVQFMYKFNQDMSTKPPLLIITNIASVDFEMYSDIWNLCGCKPIKKYIDPQIQEKEQESGDAPTMDNITEFCGFADEVKADAYKTAFINPRNMFEYYTLQVLLHNHCTQHGQYNVHYTHFPKRNMYLRNINAVQSIYT